MTEWYIAKKKTATRWVAYELEEEPEAKRGYEMKGPYRNIVECLMASNGDENLIKKLRVKEK